jgi:hypothetical protein
MVKTYKKMFGAPPKQVVKYPLEKGVRYLRVVGL